MLLERVSFQLGDNPGIDLSNMAYVIRSGRYISAIGKAKNGSDRLNSKLSMLREHRASTRVLCLAYCTNKWPKVEAETYSRLSEAEIREKELWAQYGKNLPYPLGKYNACNHGEALKRKLMQAAAQTPERGFIEATFDIGEQLWRLKQERFLSIWKKVGIPPGPWQKLFS